MISTTKEQMEDLTTEVLSEDDLATLHEMHQTELSIARVRLASRQIMPKDFDGECECGTEVPKGRIALNLYNCVDCQAAYEAKIKRFGR